MGQWRHPPVIIGFDREPARVPTRQQERALLLAAYGPMGLRRAQVAGKGLGLLHELVPKAALVALLANPRLPEAALTLSDAQKAARELGQQLLVLNAGTASEIDAAFATLRQWRADALLLGGDPFFASRRQQIVALTARDAIPAMYANREFVEEGGLMSYGNDIADGYRRAALHVGRIPGHAITLSSSDFVIVGGGI
jgi:ABC-type uncharacterized transport system substrate-binding protein